jgi:hypothetical protein
MSSIILSNTSKLLSSSSTTLGKIKDIKIILFNLLVKSIIVIGITYIIINKISDENILLKNFIIIVSSLFIFWSFSSWTGYGWKNKPIIEDTIVTFIIFIVFGIIYYTSWWNFTNILGLPLDNPLTVGYFVMLFFVTTIILASRYTRLNIVKAAGWAIGLFTVGIFIFTYSILGTLTVCKYDTGSIGVQDSPYITFSIYLSWMILIGLLFFADMIKWGETKYKILALCAAIGIGLISYTWKRCSEVEVNGEKMINKEATWINTGAYIATIAAYFNLFIGHYLSSTVFALMGYSILDQCAPKDDPRVTAVSALLVLVLPFFYFISKTKSNILKM